MSKKKYDQSVRHYRTWWRNYTIHQKYIPVILTMMYFNSHRKTFEMPSSENAQWINYHQIDDWQLKGTLSLNNYHFRKGEQDLSDEEYEMFPYSKYRDMKGKYRLQKEEKHGQ